MINPGRPKPWHSTTHSDANAADDDAREAGDREHEDL